MYIVSTSPILLFFFLLFSYVLFYFIYLSIFSSQFSLKRMFGYSATTTTINYTHCCKFYSEEDKHIAVNRLSIAEAGIYSKEHNNPH